ncbi:MAG TPA: FHA domain-containing protein, partial [Polyangiaceae bacterium]|nr:FHA domain-containing protein [Polyangiaceae bacterium]
EEDVPADKTKCGQCGSLSPKTYRFCISCGAVLKSKPELPRGRPTGGEPAKPPPPPPSKKPPPKASAGGRVACAECDGLCEAGEAFCKYCGAPLPKAPVVAAEEPVAKKPKLPSRPRPKVDLEQSDALTLEKPARSAAKPAAARPSGKGDISGKLVVIVEDGSEGRALDLSGRQVDIGSVEGDIVLAEDRYLSPRHARFFRQDGHWYLRDLESVNGVYRRLRKPVPLRHGDLVLLGLEVLEFQLVDHAERGLGHAIQHGVLVFGSPAATRRARLCQRTVEGVIRDVYHLVADETTVGRETGDIVFTSDPFMSRRHAAIQWDEDAQEYVLADLNSSNGTYVAIRDDVRLENGDFVRLGQHLFRVDLPQKPQR